MIDKNYPKKEVVLGLVQTRISPDLESNLVTAVRLVAKAASQGAQIICLPELFRTPYFPQYPGISINKFAENIPGISTTAFVPLAKKYGVVIVVPICEKNKQGEYYNSAVVINNTGRLLDAYRKIHIPHDPKFYEKNYFKPGDVGYKIYKTKFGVLSVLICYDQWFSEAARAVALRGAELIFYPTAIGSILGDKCVDGDWHNAWETVMRGHAIANAVHLVAVNRVGQEDKLKFWGQSFVCNAFGKVLKRASDKKEEIIISKVDLSSNKRIREGWGFYKNRRPETYTNIHT